MPTYEYLCRACAHTFEIVQKMSDDPLTICPECGGDLRKVFAPPAITFKGSGFYATDHGKKTRTSAPSSGAGSGGEGSGKADGTKTGETKPAGTASSTDTGGSST